MEAGVILLVWVLVAGFGHDKDLRARLEITRVARNKSHDGRVLGGTMTFFSPSEYFTIMIWPSTPATLDSTSALVIVLSLRIWKYFCAPLQCASCRRFVYLASNTTPCERAPGATV